MARISTNTSIVVPIGGSIAFTEGGLGQAILDGNIYTLGLSDVFLGPFKSAETIQIQVTSGPISYYTTAAPASGANMTPVLVDPLTGQATPSQSLFMEPVKAALIAAYEAQQARDVQNGPMLLARSGLPVAGDIPTITASATTPDADTDPATQLIYPFGNIGNIDPIPQASLERKQWYRGHSVGLRARQLNNDLIRLAETCGTFGSNGSQDQDPLLGYGIDTATVVLDFVLDGDVFFMRTQGNNGCTFSLFVNGSRVTAAPGSGITQVGSDRYHPTAKYVKLKWAAVGRRRVQMVFTSTQCASVFYTRAVSTMLPTNATPLTWLHFGDSFSQYTGASQRELSLVSWLHAAFGLEFDFVSVAQGGTGLAPGNRPGVAPAAATKASIRNQYVLHANKLRPAIATYLVGHNDATENFSIAAEELTTLLQQVASDNPGVVQCVFSTNASPGIITPGSDLLIEAALVNAARSIPGVLVVPLQTATTGRFLRGTGYVGATNGTGNADLYVGVDSGHPSDAGHRAYGQHMAAQFYAALLAS